MIDKAKEFYDKATNELIKSATLQNTLSGNIKDYLVMPEFKDIRKYVQTGNWIHM